MDVLSSLSDRAVVARAIEENAAELLLAMGRAGGGEEYRDSRIHWTIGGSPIDYHNAIVRADLDTDVADDAIRTVVARLRQHGVPGVWHLTEAMRPTDLPDRLTAHGFRLAGGEPCMAADLDRLEGPPALPGELRIEEVQDAAGLHTWGQTLALGFGEGEREANWVRDIYGVIGLGAQSPFRHYLAWLRDLPVGTASLFLDGRTAGIYFVMTAPEARRMGIGAAVTRHVMRAARDLGYRVAVLGSSDMGYSVYQRIGFETFSTVALYEWRPKGS